MRNEFVIILILICLICFSCKKDNLKIEEPPKIEEIPIEEPEVTAGINEFVIAQNYLMRVITYSLNVALLHPQMHDLQGNDYLDTRSCPTVTGPFPNVADGSLDLVMDFGTDCHFINTVGGSPDTISGILTLKKFGGPITDTATNTFLEMDELKINGKTIRFVPGNVASTSRIKFKFFNGPGGTFNYNAFIDGSVPPGGNPVFDRSQFQIIDCVTGDSLVLYPSYSGIEAFNFQFIDPDNPLDPPTYTYNSLVEGCYEININPVVGFYYDSNGNLLEDYNITKVDNKPLLFKPLCKWIYGGKLEYDDIPMSDPNFSDAIDNPFMSICYGSDEMGIENDDCDPYIMVTKCDEFLVHECIVGADTTILTCPL